MKKVFDTDKRIKLGIWGLGRGMSFYKACKSVNIDVVAGCDYNEHMRKGFLAANPGAFVSADADEFLAQDFDAVLVATFCPNHAEDSIRCLRAGKHVLSEVTAFHTMAEGVALVDEVEKAGKVYNLAENYPFSEANSYLARKWREGLFGELMYAEYEYVHNCRPLQYTYIDRIPVSPGHHLHSWRSWINFHYYCTHSLGPIMVITGTRPTRVVSLPSEKRIAGYIYDGEAHGLSGLTPSLINMSNGSVIRNLMGSSTNDTHIQRLWGTLGSAEINVGKNLQLRLGGDGLSPLLEVIPKWDDLGDLAAKTGHGGGDFWILYYFARQILMGEAAPFDIYGACDVTIPGILALRSACEGGKPYEVPDMRDKAAREAWRRDNWAQPRIDTKTYALGANPDPEKSSGFSKAIADLCTLAPQVRAFSDWRKVEKEMRNPEELLSMGQNIASNYEAICDAYRRGRKMIEAFPGTQGARVIREMMELGFADEVLGRNYLRKLKLEFSRIKRKYSFDSHDMLYAKASDLQPGSSSISSVTKPGASLKFPNFPEFNPGGKMYFVNGIHKGADGIIYIRGEIDMPLAGRGILYYGSDGPVRVWVNGTSADCQPKATNPIIRDEFKTAVKWKKGRNEIIMVLGTCKGSAWGVCARGVLNSAGKAGRKK